MQTVNFDLELVESVQEEILNHPAVQDEVARLADEAMEHLDRAHPNMDPAVRDELQAQMHVKYLNRFILELTI